MSVGLKNDLDQVPELVADFDFAVNEQCFQYEECDRLAPFIRREGGVHRGVQLDPADFCPQPAPRASARCRSA